MYFNYLLIVLLCCIVLIVILFLVLKKRKKLIEKLVFEKHDLEVLRKGELKDYFKEEWEQEEKALDYERRMKEFVINADIAKLENQYKLDESKFVNALKNLQIQLNEKEARYEEVNQDLNLYREGKIKEIDGTAAEYEQRKRTEIEQILKQAELNANSNFNNQVDSYLARRSQMECELEAIKKDLEVERSKRAAINEEIRRQREVEEQTDFYRIQLDSDDANDIEILRSITSRLRHPEAINKVIWTGYYQKPLAELRKRLLPNGDISGIYKITRLKTNEIYIGQTTSIDKRWQDHVKSALGVGTLASSQLHRVMAADGAENFTFEIIEEVPKDKLRERESYYIDFYDSKTYGLNSVSGDKK